jgi:hypothetical protein
MEPVAHRRREGPHKRWYQPEGGPRKASDSSMTPGLGTSSRRRARGTLRWTGLQPAKTDTG